MPKEKDDAEKFSEKFNSKILASIILLPIIMWLWPRVVPFGLFEFWRIRGGAGEWLYSAWPIFAWAAGVTIFIQIMNRNELLHHSATDIAIGGTVTSIIAGVGEEICFRWLFFLDAIVSVKIANFLFFGFLGFGLPELFHTNIWGPIANLTTLHYLEPYLFHTTGWAVGAALLSTNAFFRDGHKYQGPIGYINSWFIGMFLFWLMFRYGLLAAILVHFAYDFLIGVIEYFGALIKDARGLVVA